MKKTIAVLLMLATLPSYSGPPENTSYSPNMTVTAQAVDLFPGDPARRHIGTLEYLGGVALKSSDPAFGGYSSMRLDSGRFTLLSDMGSWISFRLAGTKVQDLKFGALPAGPGIGWEKADRDSESLTATPDGKAMWVGFENSNEIWRYDSLDGRATGHVHAPAMRRWPRGGGAESMVRLRDGRFVVISEMGKWRGGKGRAAILFTGDPVEHPRHGFRFAYQPPEKYDPSDMIELPDGRLLVLNRRLSFSGGFTAKLTLLDPAQIKPGKLVTGPVIATLAAPALHDNFEALAATREQGRTVVWIASDDNQSLFEKSYLLKFALNLPPR